MSPALDQATALLTISVFLSKTLMHFSYGLWFETKFQVKKCQMGFKSGSNSAAFTDRLYPLFEITNRLKKLLT